MMVSEIIQFPPAWREKKLHSTAWRRLKPSDDLGQNRSEVLTETDMKGIPTGYFRFQL